MEEKTSFVIDDDKKRIHEKYLVSRLNKKSAEDPYNVEAWYKLLQPYTFETEIAAMTLDEAEALLASYRAKFMKGHSVSESQRAVLQGISTKLDTVIKKLDKGNGCFIRLSTRSPKDAALAPNEAIGEQMAKALRERHMLKLAASKIISGGIPAQVFGSVLKIKSGEEALRLLVESERVYMDLLLLLDAMEGAKVKQESQSGEISDLIFNINYILRAWSNIPVGMEFRGFVFNKTLTALTQYDNLVYYSEVAERKAEIERMIKTYYDTHIRKCLSVNPAYDCCVIDFAMFPDWGSGLFAMVVELNPFNNYDGAGTGGSLFSWSGEDREILEGRRPFEFRILTSSPNLEGRVYPDWEDIIKAGEKILLEGQKMYSPSPKPSDDAASGSKCTVM